MGSPPPSNLLLDPLSELTSIIQLNAFGLDLSGERTHIVLGDSFPITPEDRDRIAIESIRSGEIQPGVVAKAVLGLMGGEGEAVVVLDQRGYTASVSAMIRIDDGGLSAIVVAMSLRCHPV